MLAGDPGSPEGRLLQGRVGHLPQHPRHPVRGNLPSYEPLSSRLLLPALDDTKSLAASAGEADAGAAKSEEGRAVEAMAAAQAAMSKGMLSLFLPPSLPTLNMDLFVQGGSKDAAEEGAASSSSISGGEGVAQDKEDDAGAKSIPKAAPPAAAPAQGGKRKVDAAPAKDAAVPDAKVQKKETAATRQALSQGADDKGDGVAVTRRAAASPAADRRASRAAASPASAKKTEAAKPPPVSSKTAGGADSPSKRTRGPLK